MASRKKFGFLSVALVALVALVFGAYKHTEVNQKVDMVKDKVQPKN